MSEQRAPAGWYQQGDVARYWDGGAWTNDYRPLPPPQVAAAVVDPPPPAPARDDRLEATRRKAAAIMGGGAVAIAAGSFLPWIKITAPFVGTISKSGVDDGGDGLFFVAAAIGLAVLAWRIYAAEPTRWRKWRTAALVVAIGVTLGYELADLSSRFADAKAASDLISTSYGSGLFLIGAGVLAAAVGWLQMPWSHTIPPSHPTGGSRPQ